MTFPGSFRRHRHHLPLQPGAEAFAKLIRQHGQRPRVAESDIDAWLRGQAGGIRGMASARTGQEIQEKVEELNGLLRGQGLSLCAELLGTLKRLVELETQDQGDSSS